MDKPENELALESALDGRFSIEREIGHGGQATVYLAIRNQTIDGERRNQAIALKVYKSGSADERVEREITALRGFEHPCLSHFLEQGSVAIGGEIIRYVAWVYIPGEDLRTLISQHPLPTRTVAVVGRDVSRALSHLWTKRIVHRDVNPRNVIVRDDGAGAVLIDLGVARHLDQTTITPTGMTWGTMGYLSPEQWGGGNLSCLSDVFSLGITLQEALAGRHPSGGSQSMFLASPPRTSSVAPVAPAALADLIDRCLAVRPAFRPAPVELIEHFSNLAGILN